MIQHYELLMIFPVTIEDKKREEAIKKIMSIINDIGGKSGTPVVWGNQKLAFEIKHQTNGFYVLLEFDQVSEMIKKIDADMRLMPELLRYLITTKKIKSDETIAKEKMIQEKIAVKKNEAVKQEIIAKEKIEREKVDAKKLKENAVKKAKADAGKISLDDLDEKLDEILKEEI